LSIENNDEFEFKKYIDVIKEEQSILPNQKHGFRRDLRSDKLYLVPPEFVNVF